MNYSQSWTNESVTTPADSTTDQEKTSSVSYFSENKVSSEQILIHRWFLTDIQSLKNQKSILQSSPFGCTGENGFLQWIIRFHPIAPLSSKENHSIDQKNSLTLTENNSTSSDVLKDTNSNGQNLTNLIHNKDNENVESLRQLVNGLLLNIEQSSTIKNDLEGVVQAHTSVLYTLPPSIEEDSFFSSDDTSYCAFEILRVNEFQSTSQTLFEINYQIFEIADDGILSLLKTEGRHQVHFNRALITLSRHTILSTNILFSVKLIIYECSSTVDYWRAMSNDRLDRKKLLDNDENSLCYSKNSTIGLSTGNLFWLMSIQKRFTDLILCSSDGQEFHVHRLILYSSCEKFITLNQMITRIDLHSIKGIILQRILKYLYTDEIEICMGEFVIDDIRDLFNAADFFELFQLKNILMKKCLNHITEKTCVDLLEIADDKQMKILTNRILTFLCQRYPQIFETDAWQQLCHTRPHLYNETFSNLIRLTHFQKSVIEQLHDKKCEH